MTRGGSALAPLLLGAATAAAAVAAVLAVRAPAATVAVAVACGLGALVLTDLVLGFRVFTAVAFLEILPAAGGGLSVAKLAGVALVFSWLVTGATPASRSRRFAAAHPGAAVLAGLFLVWVLMSAAWAESPRDALEAAGRYGPDLLLFPIAFAAVRTARHAGAFAAVFVGGAIVSAAYGLSRASGASRLAGAGVDPNILALALVAALALAVAMTAQRVRVPAARAGWILAAAACLAGILLTGSRGGLVSLAVAGALGVALAGRGRRAQAALLAATALAASVVYIAVLAPAATRERITHPSGGSGRADLWRVGGRVVANHPLIGVGAGNFPRATIHELLAPGTLTRSQYIVDTPKVAHNVYLEVQAELGIPGLLLFLSLIAFSLACCRAAWRRFAAIGDPGSEILARGVAVAIGSVLAAEVFVSQEFSKPLWLLLAVAPALRAIADESSRPA